jgi:isocitrate/isopropylmalate dehydrogenase
MKKTHRIAVIAGDGIGLEVVPEGLRVLEAAASRTASASRSTSSTSVGRTTSATAP